MDLEKYNSVFKYIVNKIKNNDLTLEDKKLIEKLNIKNLDTSQISELIFNYLEKLQLILVMSRDVDLYVLDEPLGGVDPATRDYILDTILSIIADKNCDSRAHLELSV